MTALPANNRNSLQSNSAAVSQGFSYGNVPLTQGDILPSLTDEQPASAARVSRVGWMRWFDFLILKQQPTKEKTMQYLLIGLPVIVLIAIIALLVSVPVMLLWNWLMPAIFGLTTITWLQALGLSVLCGLLFKSNGSSSSN